ncbi:PAP2 superfamily protein [Bacteroides pyogenes JCM 10003]|nr:PAP2 superfamily protein [Bacteroides pyogenes JCM 10003]
MNHFAKLNKESVRLNNPKTTFIICINVVKRIIFAPIMKKIVLIIFTLIPASIYPQEYQEDSLSTSTKYLQKHQRILRSPLYQITHAGIPLIIIGALNYDKDKDFRVIRNSYIPHFRYHYDDYLQYSPGMVMLGLKASGVEGRSSWGRMLVSDIFSAGIMAATVNTLKYSFRKPRPDDSSNNSFPSGHTATAFMFATMLHNEYGTTRSPLYSVLGYSLGTATAISRQLNNKHWFSDVLTGAGIGIVSTQLGYYLAGLIFREKGSSVLYLKGSPISKAELMLHWASKWDIPSVETEYIYPNISTSSDKAAPHLHFRLHGFLLRTGVSAANLPLRRLLLRYAQNASSTPIRRPKK